MQDVNREAVRGRGKGSIFELYEVCSILCTPKTVPKMSIKLKTKPKVIPGRRTRGT